MLTEPERTFAAGGGVFKNKNADRYGNRRAGPVTKATDGKETVETREKDTDGTETTDFLQSLVFSFI